MKPPCDDAVLLYAPAGTPCREAAAPWILAATILASSMTFIDGTVVNVALPVLQSSLGATVVDVQWVVESYALFLGALILVGGSAGDLFGRRRVFLGGTILFAAASAWCGFAPTIRQLQVARAVQGIGAAFLVPGSLAIISASFDAKSRGKAIGTWSAFTSITTAIGPVLGGWLIEHASWRWAFFINPPIAAAVVLLTLWQVPESRSATARRIDWLGALAVTLGLGGLVFGFLESTSLGWRHPAVCGSLTLGAICLLAFLRIEARERFPMVPLELFRSPAFSGANLLTLFFYAALGMFFFLYPLNLIQVQGYTATATGAAALPLILLMFSLSRWSGGLVDRYGPRPPLILGPLIAAAGFLLFALPSLASSYWTAFFPAFLVLGFGTAVTVAPLTTVVMGAVVQDRAGTASGINNAVSRVAGLLSVALLGLVMVAAFRHQLEHRLAGIPIPSSAHRALMADSIRLAAIKLPPELDATASAAVKASVQQSFVSAFRLEMFLCAVLAVCSSAGACWMIRDAKQ